MHTISYYDIFDLHVMCWVSQLSYLLISDIGVANLEFTDSTGFLTPCHWRL